MKKHLWLLLIIGCGTGKVKLEDGTTIGDSVDSPSDKDSSSSPDTGDETNPDTASDTGEVEDSATDTEDSASDTEDSAPPEDTAIGPEPADNDADGYNEDEDCDDSNAQVNPGATEVCDGLDNDCDGVGDTDSVCPCPVGNYGDHSYLFCSDATDWYSASDTCQSQLNYQLVVISDEPEQTWVWNTAKAISTEWWWIGFHDTNASSSQEPGNGWEWVDGSSVSYTNWASGQPDDWQEEDCGHIYGDNGTWNDLACWRSGWEDISTYYICESN
jgi:hypothetical protein